MINETNLIEPADDFANDFPELEFSNRFQIKTNGESILVCDPTYLADVYNSCDLHSQYLQKNAIFLKDFVGDCSGPILWQEPFVLLPASISYNKDHSQHHADNVSIMCGQIAIDSGSVCFLSTEELPREIGDEFVKLKRDGLAAELPVPAGRWTAMYEQMEVEDDLDAEFFRNIVLRHSIV